MIHDNKNGKIFLIIFMLLFLSVSLAAVLSAKAPEDFVYDGKGKRDPFIPLVTQTTRLSTGLENVQTVEDIILEGIVWDAHGDSVAVLNGVIMREGQQIEGVRIKEIEEKSVVLFINKVEYKVDLIREGEED